MPKSKAPTLPVPAATRARPDLSYLGPPALLAGEDTGGYEALLARVSASLAPQDALEDIWARDVVDLTWEIFRLRRLKTALLEANAHRGVASILGAREALLPRSDSNQTGKQWACGDATASAVVAKTLEACGLTMDAVRAETLARHLDQIERIDGMTMAAERRREAMLRDLERHRTSFAQPLRRALGEAEDAEYTVVAPEAAA